MKALLAIAIFGIAPFLGGFRDRYEPAMGEELAVKVAEARCAVCHTGTSKKQRNEYGQALAKVLHKEDFDLAKQRKDPLGFQIGIARGLQAVESQKASDGRTFAERISSGELPAVK